MHPHRVDQEAVCDPIDCRAMSGGEGAGGLVTGQARGKAQVSQGTVQTSRTAIALRPATCWLRSALELAGVAILSDGETIYGRPGVRLKTSTGSRAAISDGEAGIIQNTEM